MSTDRRGWRNPWALLALVAVGWAAGWLRFSLLVMKSGGV
jgi:hypothetical protein